jgi:hypothetical protein
MLMGTFCRFSVTFVAVTVTSSRVSVGAGAVSFAAYAMEAVPASTADMADASGSLRSAKPEDALAHGAAAPGATSGR